MSAGASPGAAAGFRFRCSTCGEEHRGLPSLVFEHPEPYLAVPEDQRGERTELTSDTCVVDGEHFFVRARLEIPVQGHDEVMSWGVWVSLSERSFSRFEELFDQPGREREGPWFGWFSSSVPGYPETFLLKTHVHLQPVPMRPLVELEPTGHPLAVAQREGITPERARELVHDALHPEAGA